VTLDYDGFATGVTGLGPGTRTVLWTRGCGIGCKGCMTKILWPTGERRPIEPLAEQLIPVLRSCDGLSISGGEPFDQPEELAHLIDLIREDHDVHVFCYSGYRLERLKERPEAVGLLDRLDMLMDGPYVDSLPTEKPWRGSDNQELHLLSERAKADAPEDWRKIQLQPLSDGSVRLIGIPKRGDLVRLSQALRQKGLRLGSEL
jgi:anaerobic ribonucleoside-triphosphate reductase activating protein